MIAVPPQGTPVPATCAQSPQPYGKCRDREKPSQLRRRLFSVLPVILFILPWSLLGLIPALAAIFWICGVGR
jgi:hypothetical protein